MQKKKNYMAPVIEVMELEYENVIAGSILGYSDGDDMLRSPVNRQRGNRQTTHVSDLEELINDILTFEK